MLTAEKVAGAGNSLRGGKFPMWDDSDRARIPTRFASRNPPVLSTTCRTTEPCEYVRGQGHEE
jgi:hypothetical protein